MSKPRSENCFYCTTCSLTLEEVTEHVQHLVQDAEAEILRRCNTYVPNCKFTINMPMRDGKSQKHCFVWVTNREVHRMLSGLNYDGRKIVKSEAAKEPVRLSALEELRASDWADTTTSEFRHYAPPVRSGFKLGEVVIDRVGKGYVEGKLFCSVPLPESYPTRRLNEIFEPFVTSGHLCVVRSRERASIIFSNQDDAYFALCMLRKTRDEEYDLDLAFNYCKGR